MHSSIFYVAPTTDVKQFNHQNLASFILEKMIEMSFGMIIRQSCLAGLL